MKFFALIALLGIALFCVFGFLATFEPIERGQQLGFRTAYGVAGLASMGRIVWILVEGRRSRKQSSGDE
ncbi:MAG: hypothetical protein ACI9F9_003011 [Candidatus Paceibacteria bacterium]|jgi:hypothetical protein